MDSIEQLAELAANGDAQAFETLYEYTYRYVYFTCVSFLKNEQDALDATQEVYLTALASLSSLADRSKFIPWLNKIAANKCKDMLKRKQPVFMDYESIDNLQMEENENFLPEEYVSNQVKRNLVMQIMQNVLSDTLYQTVILYYFDGLSVSEISEIMDCPTGTVTYRLSAARAKIKEGVLQYENLNNDRLYAFSGVPLLTALLTAEVQNMQMPYIAPAFLVAAPTNIIAAQVAGQAARTGVKTMFKTLKAKIIAGVAAAAVVGGGTAALVIMNNSDDKDKKNETTAATELAQSDEATDEVVTTNEEVTTDAVTEETEDTTEETTEEELKLADNEIVCGYDTVVAKAVINMPEGYVLDEKTDSYITYESESGNHVFIQLMPDETAEEYFDFIIGNTYLTNADEITHETGTMVNDAGTEYLWANFIETTVMSGETYIDRSLDFVSGFSTSTIDSCCINVSISNYLSGEELIPENFADIISSSVIQIETY